MNHPKEPINNYWLKMIIDDVLFLWQALEKATPEQALKRCKMLDYNFNRLHAKYSGKNDEAEAWYEAIRFMSYSISSKVANYYLRASNNYTLVAQAFATGKKDEASCLQKEAHRYEYYTVAASYYNAGKKDVALDWRNRAEGKANSKISCTIM